MSAQLQDEVEVEWQFDARSIRDVAAWLEGVSLPGFTITPQQTRHLVDRYLDTPDWRVYRAGYTARIREQDGVPELTLKSMARPSAGIRRRHESTEALAHASLEALPSAGSGPAASLRALAGRQSLAFLFTLRTERRTYDLADQDGPLGEIALDDTTAEVEPPGPALARVEVEVEGEALERAAPFVERLVGACHLAPAEVSKFEAGLAASGRQPPEPPVLGSTDITDRMPATQVAYAVMRRHYAAFLEQECATRLGHQSEALHQMRVAARRLRAAISAFRPFLPSRFERYRVELDWLAGILGEVRDLDVQLEELAHWRDDPGHSSVDLESIAQLLGARRRRARRRLLAVLDSRRYRLFAARFGIALRRGPPRRGGLDRSPILAAAPDLLERRHRALRKAARGVTPESPPAAYHRLRIEAKKLRYALEFVGPVYGQPAIDFSRRLTTLQDLLGKHQDADVAQAMLKDLADRHRRLSPGALMSMGAISERHRLTAAELRDEFPAVYAGASGKEWKRLRRLLEACRVSPRPPPRPVSPDTPALYAARAKPQQSVIALPPPAPEEPA